MRTRKRFGTMLSVLIAWPAAALAQTDAPPPTSTPPTASTPRTTAHRPWNEPASRWQKASDVVGKNVNNPSGDKIGEVENIIVDTDSGRVIYMIVSCDGRSCAVPPGALSLPADGKSFTLAFSKEQLKSYSFDKKEYPNFTDRGWASQVYSHFGQPFYWERSSTGSGTPVPTHDEHPWYRFTSRAHKSTELIGMQVKNPEKEDLGKIEDLVVDPDGGRVIYAVLSFGGFLGMGDKLFAIPMSSLDLASDGKQMTLNVDKDRLKNASGFDKKSWPNMADQRWATETHTYYNQPPYWEEPSSRRDTGREPRDVRQETVTEVWICTMHPSTRQNTPGKCSICQMELTRESKP